MRVLVCGGREYNAYWVLKEELGKLSLTHKITEVIEGGAKGADALAREWAHRCGVKNTTYAADWLGEGPKAGPSRHGKARPQSRSACQGGSVMVRPVPEWIAKSDDAKIPDRVRDRIFERDGHVCHICKLTIKPGETWDADHVIALINGGEHRERNLSPAHKHCHITKSAIDVKVKAKIARVRQRHNGVKRPTGKLRGPSFPKFDKPRHGIDKSVLPELPRRPIYRKEEA